MKTKEEIIAVIDSTNHLSCDDCVAIKHHLTQPTLNPMRIDEERMRECFEQVFTKDIYLKSHFKTIVDQYNSTLEDHQVLQPLPSDEECNEIAFRKLLLTGRTESEEIKDRKLIIEGLTIMRSIASPLLASHVARIKELEEEVKLINGDLDSSLEIINSLRSSCP